MNTNHQQELAAGLLGFPEACTNIPTEILMCNDLYKSACMSATKPFRLYLFKYGSLAAFD